MLEQIRVVLCLCVHPSESIRVPHSLMYVKFDFNISESPWTPNHRDLVLIGVPTIWVDFWWLLCTVLLSAEVKPA